MSLDGRILKPDDLAALLDEIRLSYKQLKLRCEIVVTSGGYAPLHDFHLQCFKDATRLGNIWIAIVNGDGFLQRKHGYVFQNEVLRARIIAALRYVHYVTIWDDGSQNVSGAIKLLKPTIFAKGGPYVADSMNEDEKRACRECKTRIVYGVGGEEKGNSSSDILNNFIKQTEEKNAKSI